MATMSRLPGFPRLCVVLFLLLTTVDSALEPGRKTFIFTSKTNVGIFLKSLYKDAIISISGRCSHKSANEPVLLITGLVKYGRCAEQINDLENLPTDVLESTVDSLSSDYQLTFGEEVNCSTHIKLKDQTNQHQGTVSPPPTAAADVEDKDEPDQVEPGDENGEENTGPDEGSKTAKAGPDEESKTAKAGPDEESKTANAGSDEESKNEDTAPEEEQPDDENGEENTQTEDESITDNTEPEQNAQAPVAGNTRTTNPTITATTTTRASSMTASAATQPSAPEDEESNNSRKRRSIKKKHEKKHKTPKKMKNDKKELPFSAEEKTQKHETTKKALTIKKPETKAKMSTNDVLHIEKDGVYILMIKVVVKDSGQENPEDDPEFALTLDVSMKNKVGYLSAADWPLLPFYGAMSLLYLTYGIVWLVISACYWRDILRIQFWIGGVIALGMLEKAIFYSEYSKLNHEGYKTGSSLLIFAEVVSCFKRTLARILILIVSMGFGIVRPRLGSTLHKVLGVGFMYFLLATIEGCYRTVTPTTSASKEELIARIPLAVLDSAICWWIFMSLVQTTRTLRIRRNTIKLSLYRHFTNTLIFAVLASLAYMIYSIKEHTFTDCIDDWSELWFDEAFWHFLFSLILLVIMILWRPSANNQRYAFTPLVDLGEEDDEDNITLSEAFEGMKLRNTKNPSAVPDVKVNGDSKRTKAEDDLKWVEENIPTSGDIALPSLMDSDEELMTTKFEISKME